MRINNLYRRYAHTKNVFQWQASRVKLPVTHFDPELIARYDRPGPRYTSYPTAVQFTEEFARAEYQAVVIASNEEPIPRPLSLYVHIPFCASPCFYCGCMKIVTRNYSQGLAYLARLEHEIALQGRLFAPDRAVEQLHFGGGTPTFFGDADLDRVMRALAKHFRLELGPTREISIELDPRTVDRARLARLAALGFNRASLGVQDFEPEVQQAVNRVQSASETLALLEDARNVGFKALSVDLIYGLPRQTCDGFARTLARLSAARPDRIAVYGYAHLPQMFKPQRQIRVEDLPSAAERLALLSLTVEKLTQAGYVYIGMDHFALPHDELVQAQASGHLQRNFQGYSTRGYCDIVGLGVSAIGRVGENYAQNAKALGPYFDTLARDELPVQRGLRLNQDDLIRRDVIQQIMCDGKIDFAAIGARHGIEFSEYFAAEIATLSPLVADGLAEFTAPGLRATARGRFLLRHLAMPFDAYFNRGPSAPVRFSKAI